jgi:hypothetical protein
MFKCKECGKEFGDWHALGGHMRTHWATKERQVPLPTEEEQKREVLSRAMGKLSELSPQEAWQIVVNWIMDVYRQMQLRDEIIQTYRLRLQDSETRVQAVQSDLKKLQQAVEEGTARSSGDQQ